MLGFAFLPFNNFKWNSGNLQKPYDCEKRSLSIFFWITIHLCIYGSTDVSYSTKDTLDSNIPNSKCTLPYFDFIQYI